MRKVSKEYGSDTYLSEFSPKKFPRNSTSERYIYESLREHLWTTPFESAELRVVRRKIGGLLCESLCDGASPGMKFEFPNFREPFRSLSPAWEKKMSRAYTWEIGTPRQRRDTYSYLLPRNISAASVKTYTHDGFLRELRASTLREFRRVAGETSSRFPVSLRRWWTRVLLKPESRKRMRNREIG